MCIGVIAAAVAVYLFARYQKKEQSARIYCLILAVSGILGILVCIDDQGMGNVDSVVRREPGDGSYTEKYVLGVEDLKLEESYDLTVENRHLDETEKRALFLRAIEEATTLCLEKNESADHVDHDLVLAKSVCDGLVKVNWSFDHYRAMDINGKLAKELPEEGTLVTVTADLSYEKDHMEHTFTICVFPANMTEEEAFYAALEETIDKANAAVGGKLQLPGFVDGHQISWKKPKNNMPDLLVLLGIVSCAAMAIGKKTDEKKARQNRMDQLQQEFPQMLSQMSLLLSAGMTVYHAWGKIVQSYERSIDTADSLTQAVYEEMAVTWRQMKDGVGERDAYEQFGQRIGLQCYRKFANLLTQNLRKGTAGLSALLEKEVETAFADQESMIKKRGEELETKLLGPMLVMLLLVMVLILIPATSGFQITM